MILELELDINILFRLEIIKRLEQERQFISMIPVEFFGI